MVVDAEELGHRPREGTMNLRQHAESAAAAVYEALGAQPSEDQADEAVKAIEKALITAVLEVRSLCVDTALECASADKDIAHKIADDIRRGNNVLIANLSSLR
jgi:propanediol dehydratase large subunit